MHVVTCHMAYTPSMTVIYSGYLPTMAFMYFPARYWENRVLKYQKNHGPDTRIPIDLGHIN